ncbi:MAG: hypothetical protein WD468_09625 [Pirellulales bacterium]
MPRDEWAKGRRRDVGNRVRRELAEESERDKESLTARIVQVQIVKPIDPIRSFEEWEKLINDTNSRSELKNICIRILNQFKGAGRSCDLFNMISEKARTAKVL